MGNMTKSSQVTKKGSYYSIYIGETDEQWSILGTLVLVLLLVFGAGAGAGAVAGFWRWCWS